MEESKIRALILEEIQGIISQVSEQTKGDYSLAVVARSVSEIIADRLNAIKGERKNEKDQDTEIGKDPV